MFALNANGTASFTNLYEFADGNDGGNPEAGLVLSGDALYGTTENGGTNGSGSVFAVNSDGTGFTNVYSFTGDSDGAVPLGGLILSGGTLYGTASEGGTNGSGTVFAVNTNGTGFTVLHGLRPLSSTILRPTATEATPASRFDLIGKHTVWDGL